jgi:acyl-lipid omega-6 desaturase (Delta-12 desaturase)
MRRPERELLLATRPFTVEDRARSVRATAVTFAVLAACATAAAWDSPARSFFAVVEGLVIVRAFCLFHDFQHGALLRGSTAARAMFWCFGELILVPPSVWRETHNYHHAHTAQAVGSHIGSYPFMPERIYRALDARRRFAYRAARHPLTIALALLTVFLFGMCVKPFVRAPRRHFSALLSVLAVGGLALAAHAAGRFDVFVFAWLVPMAIAAALGETWTYSGAALDSSSYLELGPVMRWFTANIGYHHVHHLNAAIPFYRLPEAMEAIPELQSPGRTSLAPRDVAACLRIVTAPD